MPTLSDTHIRNRYRVQPNDANNYETLHGGELMKWMDELGAMAAMRFAGETCVTAGVDDFGFHRPIPVGDTALVDAYVYRAGKTSVTVRLRAWREDPRTGETERTTGSSFTFVAIDEDRNPVRVPELTVETDEEERLLREALEAES
ncbi:acyl-CoA thioesterase [Halorussus salilacus]|uniref:acyl-CoA thioesterase n=1 Tax=Halorussus salilacus TaxID=2953750 RepID=UPI00209E272A|nr:acyl-CoA thioesterase [Halorussus salilacus]USZ67117.1 acyl-CoA thioesterase [Halorussus salilacus]